MNDLNALFLLSHESIKIFARRLNVLAAEVYPEILDKVALSHIKYVKLIACLPSTIRIKLQEESSKTYEKELERAQVLQEIFIQDNDFLVSDNNNVNDQLQSKIADLSGSINNLNFEQAVKK